MWTVAATTGYPSQGEQATERGMSQEALPPQASLRQPPPPEDTLPRAAMLPSPPVGKQRCEIRVKPRRRGTEWGVTVQAKTGLLMMAYGGPKRMSTRACYRFIPENGPNDWPGVVTVYKHHDGYPSGAAEAIEAAIAFAWPLPRYEADEFAAAFVAANKSLLAGYHREFFELGQKPATREIGERLRFLREQITEYTTGRYAYFRGGGVRLVPFEGLDAHKRFASDTEYLYDIRCVGGKIQVTGYTTREDDGEWTIEKFFEGSTKQLARRKP